MCHWAGLQTCFLCWAGPVKTVFKLALGPCPREPGPPESNVGAQLRKETTNCSEAVTPPPTRIGSVTPSCRPTSSGSGEEPGAGGGWGGRREGAAPSPRLLLPCILRPPGRPPVSVVVSRPSAVLSPGLRARLRVLMHSAQARPRVPCQLRSSIVHACVAFLSTFFTVSFNEQMFLNFDWWHFPSFLLRIPFTPSRSRAFVSLQ